MRQQKQQKQYQRQPQQQPALRRDDAKARWQGNIAAAKEEWGRLTTDELIESGGQPDKLNSLLCERYALTQHQAEEQIKNFFDSCKRG